jgi:hypothetical protein
MDRGDAARMERRKKLAIEFVEQRASDLRVVLTEVVWNTQSRDGLWSLRVTWEGGFRFKPVPEDLLMDEDTEPQFEEVIRRWFDEEVALLCPELDDYAELGQRSNGVDR